MSERNPTLTMSYSGRAIELLIDHYGRLTRIERSGRIYELLGIRRLYLVVARLLGEPVLPGSRDLCSNATRIWSETTVNEARERRDRTLYYEISNLVIFLFYIPIAVMLGVLHSLGIVYAAILCGFHVSLVLIERYKRALYGVALEHAAATPDSDANAPDSKSILPSTPTTAASPGGFAAWYFVPRRFETDRLYRVLGMETVRNWVITFTRLTALVPEQRHRNPRTISGAGIAGLIEFDHETRISEVSHMVGFLLQLPFLALFTMRRMPLGIAYIVFLLCLNLSFILLQRATRVRLWRVLSKRRVSRQ